MEARAYCKINVALNVIRRRADGYHDIESVMLPLELADILNIEKKEGADEFICDQALEFNEKNTVVKAIKLFRAKYGITDSFKVVLQKRVPMEAGLGGGSGDAACTFRLLSRLYDIDIEADIDELCHQIGSDVIFTYYHRPAFVGGTGEELTFFALKKSYYVLLVKPAAGVSTRDAYQQLNLDLCNHPNCQKLMEALIAGDNLDGLLGNSLEESAWRLCEDVALIQAQLRSYGLKNVLMSGSGSCVFALSEDEEELRRVFVAIKDRYFFVNLSRVLISC